MKANLSRPSDVLSSIEAQNHSH